MAPNPDMNAFIEELFQNRYTCKGYDPERTVSDRDFATILEAGRLSPSSMGFEPWHFVRLQDKETITQITPYTWGAQAQFAGCSHILLLLGRQPAQLRPGSDYLRHIHFDVQGFPEEMWDQRMKKVQVFQDHDQQMDSERAVRDWIGKQVYIAMANMLTAAAMLGVDSTPIEGFESAEVNQVLIDRGVFDPKVFRLTAMMCFGYSNRDHRHKTRRPISEVFSTF